MSIEEFNALYEKSVEAISSSDLKDDVRQLSLTLLRRMKLLVDKGEMDVDQALDLLKQLVVALFMSPSDGGEPGALAQPS